MKLKKLITFTLLSAVTMGVGALPAFAEDQEVKGQTKETPTTVEIGENDSEIDPLDPNDETQKMLTLDNVPTAYDFKTQVSNINYEANTSLTDQSVGVFNDRTKRDWKVKAKVVDNKISAGADKTFDVTQFQINGQDLVGTGETGIVAKAAENKTAENNTGLVSTSVTSAKINFVDPDKKLKSGNTLTGKISYQLYNITVAE